MEYVKQFLKSEQPPYFVTHAALMWATLVQKLKWVCQLFNGKTILRRQM